MEGWSFHVLGIEAWCRTGDIMGMGLSNMACSDVFVAPATVTKGSIKVD
jgi:hypothetical protein